MFVKAIFSFKVFEDGTERGLFETRTFNELVAVVGNNTWEVMNGRKKLTVNWEPMADVKETVNIRGNKREELIPAGLASSAAQLAAMQERAKQPATLLRKDGDPETAFKNAAQILERTYTAPFRVHNCMEPMNCFAHVTPEKALFVGPLQTPGFAEETLAARFGLPKDKIDIQMTRMGGGFGRRAYPHYMVEAGVISQKVKAPVKLV